MGKYTYKSAKKGHCVAIIALIILTGAKGVRANLVPVNSNSIVQDGIEYYIETDKAVYDLGEDVEMLYRVTNLKGEDVLFSFSHGPEYRQCDFVVEKDGESIWDTLDWPVTGVITSFTLNPLESREYSQLWNMTYNNGDPIMQGIYDITGVLSYYTGHERYVPVSVQVEIIPEPASLLLLGTGLAGLLRYRKRKGNYR